ncbi:unnamed protein product [Mytilus edulis]|uniref:EGF-like domain-containing protein n=1 Tax=Mytilus edulis TaxID=6550 RepID=A0A8S3T1M0_MYTED|nr:unnamed protein product [Mytilus edulis]
MHIAILLLPVYVESFISMVATGQNVCPQIVIRRNSSGNKTQLIFNCCPNYFLRDGKCQECPAGKWGQHCLLECLENYHGVQCKNICNCLDGKKCDPVHGCICDIGFNGPQCSNVCPYGSYGVQCSKECSCANDADCDPVSGVCICHAGWFGNHCTQACSNGTYGTNCTAECMCSKDAKCDHVTGECVCPAGRFGYNCTKHTKVDENSGNSVLVYIMMAAALTGLICVVALFVKAKEAIIRKVHKCNKNPSKPNIERRKAKRRLSSALTEDAHTESSIIDTETSLFHNPKEEELYCEIEDIDDLNRL